MSDQSTPTHTPLATPLEIAKMERDSSPWTELYQDESGDVGMSSESPRETSHSNPDAAQMHQSSPAESDESTQDALTKAFNW